MADGVTIDEGTGKLISTEDVTTLNAASVTSQQVQRVAAAVVTANGVAVDLPGSTADGLLVNLGANNDVTVSGVATAANQATQITAEQAILAKLLAAPATEAKQDTGNTSLASILAKLIAAPATEVKQDTQITAEQAILAKLSADPATQTTLAAILAKIIAAPATEAKQDTGNTSVASIDTKTPALGQALAAASVPVVLTASQLTTLTPPAAITGFATSAKQAALGTAGSASSDVITVQGATTGTPLPTKETRSATPTQSSVASSATNVTVLALNANRLGATVYNDSTQILYLKLGATASTTSHTIQMAAGSYYEVPFAYTGIIDGLWASANGNARVTEVAA